MNLPLLASLPLVLLGLTIRLHAEQEEPLKNISTETSGERIDGKSVVERQNALLNYCAGLQPLKKTPKETIDIYLSRVLLDRDREGAFRDWENCAKFTYDEAKIRMAASKTGKEGPAGALGLEPFDKFGLVYAWMIARDHATVPENIIKYTHGLVSLCHHKVWTGYGALNYRLMMDGSGFIAAEQWPDLVDADGLNAEAIKTATKERLLGYFQDIVHRNYHEYGASAYAGVDMGCVKMLADDSKDPEVRQKAELTLDWMLLNLTCAWNQGYCVTPAGRAKYIGATITSPDDMDPLAGIGWIYFGALRPINPTAPFHTFWFACPGHYSPPGVFTTIAQDRRTPFLHLGAFSEPSKQEERMTIYHTPAYSLASEWNPISDPHDGAPKENRRQMLKWISDKPFSTFTPMQDSVARPYNKMDYAEGKPNAFGYGENPYTQVLQHEGTLIGITDVDSGYPLFKTYVPFSTSGSIIQRAEKDGWVFCHGGSVLFAFKTLKPSSWDPTYGKEAPKLHADVLVCNERLNGWVLETSSVVPYAGGGTDQELARFMAAILSKPRVQNTSLDGPQPSFEYLSLDGHLLGITFCPLGQNYNGQHKIDHKVVDYSSWPLLSNPWVSQQLNGDQLEIHHDGQSLVYNFKDWRKK